MLAWSIIYNIIIWEFYMYGELSYNYIIYDRPCKHLLVPHPSNMDMLNSKCTYIMVFLALQHIQQIQFGYWFVCLRRIVSETELRRLGGTYSLMLEWIYTHSKLLDKFIHNTQKTKVHERDKCKCQQICISDAVLQNKAKKWSHRSTYVRYFQV